MKFPEHYWSRYNDPKFHKIQSKVIGILQNYKQFHWNRYNFPKIYKILPNFREIYRVLHNSLKLRIFYHFLDNFANFSMPDLVFLRQIPPDLIYEYAWPDDWHGTRLRSGYIRIHQILRSYFSYMGVSLSSHVSGLMMDSMSTALIPLEIRKYLINEIRVYYEVIKKNHF